MSATQAFLRWLVDNGVEGVGGGDSPVALYETEDGERGILAAGPLAAKQVLAAVPLRLAIKDYDTAPISHLVYPGAPWSVRLAAQLMSLRRQAATPWAPYLAVLPKSVPSPLAGFGWRAVKALQYEPIEADLNELVWLATDARQQMQNAGHIKSEEDAEVPPPDMPATRVWRHGGQRGCGMPVRLMTAFCFVDWRGVGVGPVFLCREPPCPSCHPTCT